MVQSIDVLPTILELLELPVPSSAQGRSLTTLLRTGTDATREAMAISAWRGMRVIRTPTWKLIESVGEDFALYQLEQDPREQVNVARDHPEMATQLLEHLDRLLPLTFDEAMTTEKRLEWMRDHGYW